SGRRPCPPPAAPASVGPFPRQGRPPATSPGSSVLTPIRLLAAHRRALRSPLRPPARALPGKRRGLPGCSRTLVPVPMPCTPAVSTVLALADGRVLPSTASERLGSRDVVVFEAGPHRPTHFLSTHQKGGHPSPCKTRFRRGGYPFAGWGLHPLGPLDEFRRDLDASRPLVTAFPGRCHLLRLLPCLFGGHRQLANRESGFAPAVRRL